MLLELKPQYQADPHALSLLYFKSTNGPLIPLDTLAKVHQDIGPQTINHYGQLPAVTISFNLKPGASLGDVVDQDSDAGQPDAAGHHQHQLPGRGQGVPEFARQPLGAADHRHLVVYIVLGILYESYIHPLTILSGLPSAGFGALVTLFLFHMDLNIYAFVGMIMLIGIVEKNAIMQIDFALEAERNQGMTPLRGDLRRLPDPLPARS